MSFGMACIYFFISFVIMLYVFYRQSWNHINHQKKLPLVYSISEAYHQFKSGDIVFLREYSAPMTITDILGVHFNYGLIHTAYIHEKNNILYIYHSIPSALEDKELISYSYSYMFHTWNVVDEPLTEFLIKFKCMYEIHRPPQANSLTFPKSYKTNRFCTHLIANLLRHHDIIQSRGGLYFQDLPDDLINAMYDKGYRCLRFKHI